MQELPHTHSENNLYELLTSSETRPEGNYNHATWELHPKGEVNSDAVLLTSVHESMHDHLNNGTAYGLVLMIVAHLTREGVVENQKLLRLVNACRNAHEIFATYTSLLIVSSKAILIDLIKTHYPAYTKYVQQAQYLMPGIHSNHLQYAIINSLIRVCFQNPALLDYLEHGELLNIKPQDCPDQRLIQLSKYINEQRLQTWLTGFVAGHETPATAQRFVDAENDSDMIMKEPDSFNALGQALSDYVYQMIRNDKDIGFAVMESDQHLAFLDDLLAYANGLSPMDDSTMPLVADKDYDKIDALSQYESEVVVVNDKQFPAMVIPFKTYPEQDWHKLLARVEDDAYLYMISRITERFLTQYRFSDADREWLTTHHPDFIFAISVKQVVEGETWMVFVVLDDPAQLAALNEKEFPMMTSASMLLTSDKNWSPWYDQVEACSTLTLLFDLSPSTQLKQSLGIYERIDYNSFHLETDTGEHAFIILIAQGEAVVTGVFLMPCGSVLANLLMAKLEQDTARCHLLDPEKDLSDDLYWLLRVQMTRLLDESRFDFKAVSSQYALRGFRDARFHTAG